MSEFGEAPVERHELQRFGSADPGGFSVPGVWVGTERGQWLDESSGKAHGSTPERTERCGTAAAEWSGCSGGETQRHGGRPTQTEGWSGNTEEREPG